MEVEPIRKLEDVKRMYEWLNENRTVKEAECFLIGCNIALRIGDLLGLSFEQVDGKEKVSIRELKNGFRKDIPITPIVQGAIDRLKEYYGSKQFYKAKDFEAKYLFQSTSRRAFHLCQPICTQWMGLSLKTGSKDLGLDYNVNTHSMRKTWGYHAYEKGNDIAYIQALLNHRDQYTTLRYIGVTRDSVNKMLIENNFDLAAI
jgi:integrase